MFPKRQRLRKIEYLRRLMKTWVSAVRSQCTRMLFPGAVLCAVFGESTAVAVDDGLQMGFGQRSQMTFDDAARRIDDRRCR